MSTIAQNTLLPKQPPISNGVLGMIILIITESMFFAGLISAYVVNRAGVIDWPPFDQPRLPVLVTGVNTVFLITSGLTLLFARKRFLSNKNPMPLFFITMVLGLLFVGIQGYEWVKLIGYGLTASSSIYGSFFYTIIGMHGFHVLIGLSFLIYLWVIVKKNISKENTIRKINSCSLFWYFVVLIWPILYGLIYLDI